MFMARREFVKSTGLMAAGYLWHKWPIEKPKDEIPMRIENVVNGLRESENVIVFFSKEPNYVLRPAKKLIAGEFNVWNCVSGTEYVEACIRTLGYSLDVQWFQHVDGLRRSGVGLTGTQRMAAELFKHGVTTWGTW